MLLESINLLDIQVKEYEYDILFEMKEPERSEDVVKNEISSSASSPTSTVSNPTKHVYFSNKIVGRNESFALKY